MLKQMSTWTTIKRVGGNSRAATIRFLRLTYSKRFPDIRVLAYSFGCRWLKNLRPMTTTMACCVLFQKSHGKIFLNHQQNISIARGFQMILRINWSGHGLTIAIPALPRNSTPVNIQELLQTQNIELLPRRPLLLFLFLCPSVFQGHRSIEDQFASS